jgi:hypothetical protein
MSDELELPPTSAEELPVWLAEEVPFLLADEPPFWLVADVPFDEFPFVSELVMVSLEGSIRSSPEGALELSSQAMREMARAAAAKATIDSRILEDDVVIFWFIVFSFFNKLSPCSDTAVSELGALPFRNELYLTHSCPDTRGHMSLGISTSTVLRTISGLLSTSPQ